MKQLAELVPVVIFFLVYQFSGHTLSIADWHYRLDGIYSATLALMIATTLQVLLTRLLTGLVETRLWILLGVVLAFGSATVLLRNQLFIQWKPTIFNWGLAVVFVATEWFSGKSAMERLLGSQIALPVVAWRRLNMLWIGNFLVVGALNLVVVYLFSEAAWVRYKLYSMIVFMVVLSAATAAIVLPFIKHEGEDRGTP
jgi:intracellular septation protein